VLLRFGIHDGDLFGSRDVIGHMTIGLLICSFLYRRSFETIALSRIVAEICVKHLVKHIPIENAPIPIFVFKGQNLGLKHLATLCL